MTLPAGLRRYPAVVVTIILSFGLLAILPGGCPPAGGSDNSGDDSNTTDPNSPALDTDSDGIPNSSDPDIDGDGIPNTSDDDINGDGSPNDQDPDMDGDGIPNASDPTPAGGGAADPNGSDPNSTGGNGNGNGSGGGGGGTPPPVPTTVTLSELARTGGAVPDQPATVTFSAFSEPIIDSKGRVAFWGQYAGTGALGKFGLYVYDTQTTPAALRRVVHDDPNTIGVVPDRAIPSYFGGRHSAFDAKVQPIAWGAGDRLLFVSALADNSNVTTYVRRGVYRWRASDGNLARVTDFEQLSTLYPGVKKATDNQAMFQADFRIPGVTDAGFAIIGVSYLYIGDDSTSSPFPQGQSIFTSNGTSVTMVVDSILDPNLPGRVPLQAGDAVFMQPGLLTTVNGGDMLFQSTYSSDSAGDGRGVYFLRGGAAYGAIDSRTNAAWTGLPAGAYVLYESGAEYRIALGLSGHIAVDAKLVVSGNTTDAVLVWDPNAAAWASLTGSNGAVATALVSGVNDDGQLVLLAGGNPYVAARSGSTQLNTTLPTQLQSASLTWGETGAAMNNYGRAVVPYKYADDSGSGLLLWSTQQLLLVADTKVGTPASLSAIATVVEPERDRPGRSGLLNDSDELTFRATLADGAQVIYKAKAQ